MSLVATDEHSGYKRIGRTSPQEIVNHSRKEYVRGNIHTTDIEAFWSLLKRGVVRTFNQVSKAYLPLYLAEFSYRHNNRNNSNMFADVIAEC